RALFFFQAEDGIRDRNVTGVQTCALPISHSLARLVRPDMPELRADHWPLAAGLRDRHRGLARCAVRGDLRTVPCQFQKSYPRERSEERRVGKEWRSRRVSGDERQSVQGGV